MVPSMTRRRMLATAALVVPAILARRTTAASASADFEKRLADLNTRCGGRLGVAVRDT